MSSNLSFFMIIFYPLSPTILLSVLCIIHVRKSRSGNHEWTIQRHWQYWVHKTQDEDKQNQHNKKQKTQKTKMMSNIDPNCIIFTVLLRVYVTAKIRFALGITLNVRNAHAPTLTYNVHISNYIICFGHVNM